MNVNKGELQGRLDECSAFSQCSIKNTFSEKPQRDQIDPPNLSRFNNIWQHQETCYGSKRQTHNLLLAWLLILQGQLQADCNIPKQTTGTWCLSISDHPENTGIFFLIEES